MKKIIYLTILILTVFASCKDDVETPKYTFDENGDVVVANDNKALRTTDLFNSVVCGHCWKVTNIEHTEIKEEDCDGNRSDHIFYIEKETCIVYTFTDAVPEGYKSVRKITYDENSGKITNEYNNVMLTIISINPDNTITAFDKRSHLYRSILTLSPMSEEEYKTFDSEVEKAIKGYYE
ncbi:MAG: hypothetical protein IJT89_08855 [Bacteroidaceae bacterium]|nr:hypothetical protein [Bacteroidaceae bacterium]MBQ4461219.1 hypothetical protein [Bacteroidaceae bacterium]MBQ7484145.1 hypothetical protein [Bacteroidaceae bacterium]